MECQKTAKPSFSTAKKKADFVSLYISNGLHDLKEKTALKEDKEDKEEEAYINDIKLEDEEIQMEKDVKNGLYGETV